MSSSRLYLSATLSTANNIKRLHEMCVLGSGVFFVTISLMVQFSGGGEVFYKECAFRRFRKIAKSDC
jgi:hypothetical protein